MNLVELENVSGPRVRQGARLKKTRSNRTTTHDCSRRSADAEIGVRGTRGTRLFFERVRKTRPVLHLDESRTNFGIGINSPFRSELVVSPRGKALIRFTEGR